MPVKTSTAKQATGRQGGTMDTKEASSGQGGQYIELFAGGRLYANYDPVLGVMNIMHAINGEMHVISLSRNEAEILSWMIHDVITSAERQIAAKS